MDTRGHTIRIPRFPRKIQHTPDIAHLTGNPHTRSAIPVATANYERNPFVFCLLAKVARGVFQRCIETTSDSWWLVSTHLKHISI